MKRYLESIRCGILVAILLLVGSSAETEELTDAQKIDRINAMYEYYKKSFQDTPEVTVEELVAMRENDEVVIVDRRQKKEQDVSMIPAAITSDEFEKHREQYKGKTIVVYCTIGSRSGHYTKKLRKKGIEAYNLKGSILSWIHAGQKVVNKEGETRRVHVYGRKWNLVPEGYEAVW
jgi:sodium/bile acid cotransporter 7